MSDPVEVAAERACKNCARRGEYFMSEVWFHPSVAFAGFGLCTIYPKDSSLLQITPDDYVCSFFALADIAGGGT